MGRSAHPTNHRSQGRTHAPPDLHARNPQATLVWLGDTDRAIILNEEGELILTRLNPEGHREQARTKIIGSTWAHPAFAGTRFFARSDTELVCVSLEVPSE